MDPGIQAAWEQWPLGAAIITVVVLFLGFMWKFITKVGEAMTTQAKHSREALDKISDKFTNTIKESNARNEKLQERTLTSIDNNTQTLARMEATFTAKRE